MVKSKDLTKYNNLLTKKQFDIYTSIDELIEKGETEVKTKYGDINIQVYNYHRGIIPLIRGSIDLIASDIERSILNFMNYSFTFSSSFTEFLHPGSPDYGFHLKVDYIECDKEDVENFRQYYEIKIPVKRIQSSIDRMNKRIWKLENLIYDIYKSFERELSLISEEEGQKDVVFGD